MADDRSVWWCSGWAQSFVLVWWKSTLIVRLIPAVSRVSDCVPLFQITGNELLVSGGQGVTAFVRLQPIIMCEGQRGLGTRHTSDWKYSETPPLIDSIIKPPTWRAVTSTTTLTPQNTVAAETSNQTSWSSPLREDASSYTSLRSQTLELDVK